MRALLKKRSCITLFMALSGAALLAAPPGGHNDIKNNKPAVAAKTQTTDVQTFWIEDFSLPNGTTSDTGSTAWTSVAASSKAIYGVTANEFKINNTTSKGPVTFTSSLINIAGKSAIQISVTARSSADVGGWLEYDDSNQYDYLLADYLRLYYKVDGGPEILFGDLRSNIKNNCGDTILLSTAAISGSTLQIIIRGRATAADEYYYFDNISVSGIAGCQGSDIPSQVSVSVSDRLTCNVTSVTLSGSSITAGVVYNWTGPDNFAASGAIAHTSVAGAYQFTVTNPANGCSRTIPVTVAQNIAPPANVTAVNSGPITCTVTEVQLTGSSSSPNVEYQWDGPDGYMSFSAEDIATQPGDYILTVLNYDNGCITKDTTTVGFECSPTRKMAEPAAVAAAANSITTGGFEWKAYPNPFSKKTLVSFKSPSAGFISIQVYSNSGVLEKNLFGNNAVPGQEYKVQLTGLPVGIHYVFIRINNRVYTNKLISLE